MERYLEEARVLASVVGFDIAGLPTAAAEEWFVSDLTSDNFGKEVPFAATQNERIFLRKGSVGVVELEGVWVHAVKLAAGDSWDKYLQRVRSGQA